MEVVNKLIYYLLFFMNTIKILFLQIKKQKIKNAEKINEYIIKVLINSLYLNENNDRYFVYRIMKIFKSKKLKQNIF